MHLDTATIDQCRVTIATIDDVRQQAPIKAPVRAVTRACINHWAKGVAPKAQSAPSHVEKLCSH